jgi:murein hydrolase activator
MKRVLAACVIVLAIPAAAQDRNAILRQLEQERSRATTLERRAQQEQTEFERLQVAARQAAAQAMAREEEASDLEVQLVELDGERAVRESAIANRRGEIAALAGALQRLARQPPEALALEPNTPLEAARTGALVANMVAHLEGQARALRAELDALASARTAVLRTQTTLATSLARLAQERDRLDIALEARARTVARLLDERGDTAQRIARLGREAGELLERIEPAPTAPLPQTARLAVRPIPSQPADLLGLPRYLWPVRGRIVENWGQALPGGQLARGLTLEPREAASLVAPAEGTVAFAGPFRGYGQILILEHGGGYHSILAQLGRIDATVGQSVAAGEPVGRAGTDERGLPIVYLELRRHGQPVDPTPWLQAAGTTARR